MVEKKLNSRIRVLTVAKILMTETDEKNPITIKELTECLETEGITAERKVLYTDIKAIMEIFPVINIPRRGYFHPSEKGEKDASLGR